MIVINKIIEFLKDPKNIRLIIFGAFVILILLLLHQCNRTKYFKQQIDSEKEETARILNNYEAAKDKIRQGKIDKDTWRAERLGYQITLKELNKGYSKLIDDFKVEKNKKAKSIIKTEYKIKEVVKKVPIFIESDNLGNSYITFNDSLRHNANNFRILNGKIPFEIVLDPRDSISKLMPGLGTFYLELGMNLNLGLFQDKKTNKISIIAETDYPGVTFTKLEGASIMDDPKNKKILRSMRKSWGVGVNIGYGAIVNTTSGLISPGPYIGIGLSYTPKFLQW